MPTLPVCDQCGTGSWDPEPNPVCPWCQKRKYAGSREELAASLRAIRQAADYALQKIVGALSALQSEAPDSAATKLRDAEKALHTALKQ